MGAISWAREFGVGLLRLSSRGLEPFSNVQAFAKDLGGGLGHSVAYE